jgi:acyl carrier protein
MDQVINPEVLAVVRRTIAASLAVDEGRIQLESRLIDDLGADSLDFVDIVFQLDSELDMRVRETEFNFLTRLDFASPDVMNDGLLTRAVVDRLAEWLPAMRSVPDPDAVTPRQLFSMITVEVICLVASRRSGTRTAAG